MENNMTLIDYAYTVIASIVAIIVTSMVCRYLNCAPDMAGLIMAIAGMGAAYSVMSYRLQSNG